MSCVAAEQARGAAENGRGAQWAFGWAPRFGLYAWDHTDPEQVRPVSVIAAQLPLLFCEHLRDNHVT